VSSEPNQCKTTFDCYFLMLFNPPFKLNKTLSPMKTGTPFKMLFPPQPSWHLMIGPVKSSQSNQRTQLEKHCGLWHERDCAKKQCDQQKCTHSFIHECHFPQHKMLEESHFPNSSECFLKNIRCKLMRGHLNTQTETEIQVQKATWTSGTAAQP